MKKIKIHIDGQSQDFLRIISDVPTLDSSMLDITDRGNEGVYDWEVGGQGISQLPDWDMASIPFIMPLPLTLTPAYIEFLFYYRTEQYERLQTAGLDKKDFADRVVDCINNILNGTIVFDKIFDDYIPQTQFEEYAVHHNKAVVLHFNYTHHPSLGISFDDVLEEFKHAIYLAPNNLWMSYSNYLCMIFLLETAHLIEANEIAKQIGRRNISPSIKVLIFLSLYKMLSSDETFCHTHPNIIDEVEQYLEQMTEDLPAQRLELWKQKSLIAESKNDMEKAEEWIGNALAIAKDMGYTHQYHLLKKNLGDIYLKMAQFGDASKYIEAQKAYQETLKYFDKKNHPIIYADCQMNLGIIYTEIPSLEGKKHIYAGLAQSAFSESMQVYNQFDYPYQYATLCNNFANALLSMLPDFDKDRLDKISFYIIESLNIRSRKNFPEERAITLLTFLNLYFHKFECLDEVEERWYEEIKLIANEILELTENEFLVEKANAALSFVKHNQPTP